MLVREEISGDLSQKINELITKDILHYSCQLFIRVDSKMKPYGSGVFAFLNGSYYIITASHVVDYIMNEENSKEHLYIRNSKGFISVTGDFKATEMKLSGGIDIAYVKIENEVFESIKRNYKFLNINKFRQHIYLIPAAQYCIVGFPEVNIKVENGKTKTGASIYITHACKEKVYNFYNLSESHYIVLEMKGKGTDMFTDAPKKVSDKFHGISGCGLWLIIVNKIENEFILDFRLIGIMTEYHKDKYYCLIANKIEIFLEALENFEGLKLKRINLHNEKRITN